MSGDKWGTHATCCWSYVGQDHLGQDHLGPGKHFRGAEHLPGCLRQQFRVDSRYGEVVGSSPKELSFIINKDNQVCDPGAQKKRDPGRLVIGPQGGVANTVIYLKNISQGKAMATKSTVDTNRTSCWSRRMSPCK
jgi:hypothetical protein